MNSVIYTGAFLDEDSQRRLEAWWVHNIGPLLGKPICHHMTISFKPNPAKVAETPFGEAVTLEVVGWGQDEDVQAVVVKPVGVATDNSIPHVTVAVSPTGKPFMANKMLGESSQGLMGKPGLRLDAIIGWFDGHRDRFDPRLR